LIVRVLEKEDRAKTEGKRESEETVTRNIITYEHVARVLA